MKFGELMDILSVNVAFEIFDKTDFTGIDYKTFMSDTSYYREYMNREIEIIKPSFNKDYKTQMLICLK